MKILTVIGKHITIQEMNTRYEQLAEVNTLWQNFKKVVNFGNFVTSTNNFANSRPQGPEPLLWSSQLSKWLGHKVELALYRLPWIFRLYRNVYAITSSFLLTANKCGEVLILFNWKRNFLFSFRFSMPTLIPILWSSTNLKNLS